MNRPNSRPIRVLLADDHTIVRAGIRSLMEKIPGLVVVAEASDGREAVERARAVSPDVVLMDFGMPGLNGIEATVRVLKEVPAARVIILSMHANEEYVIQARQAGASGYLLKKAAVADLEAAIRTVAQGGVYLSAALMQQPRAASGGKTPPGGTPLRMLTARQREILQLIVESRNTKEIAGLLELSPKTVEFHRAKLMKRLAIRDVAGLVRYAIHHGLTPTES